MLENLTKKEQEQLKSLTNTDYDDPVTSMQVYLALKGVTPPIMKMFGEQFEELSFAELCGGNPEVAKLLITATERDGEEKKNKLLYRYVFDVKDPKEDELQRSLIPGIVKEIRNKTGLSQKSFAEKYDLSVKSIEAWESGTKKMSKYAFNYLNSCLSEKLEMIKDNRIMTLPLYIIDDEAKKYIKKCAKIDPFEDKDKSYKYVKYAIDFESEEYQMDVDDGEFLKDGVLTKRWIIDDYPADLQKCLSIASKYNCDQLWFSTGLDCLCSEIEGTLEDKIEYFLSGKYKEEY